MEYENVTFYVSFKRKWEVNLCRQPLNLATAKLIFNVSGKYWYSLQTGSHITLGDSVLGDYFANNYVNGITVLHLKETY